MGCFFIDEYDFLKQVLQSGALAVEAKIYSIV
jgi:hypothetical protein